MKRVPLGATVNSSDLVTWPPRFVHPRSLPCARLHDAEDMRLSIQSCENLIFYVVSICSVISASLLNN
jgi:hypothetical protein